MQSRNLESSGFGFLNQTMTAAVHQPMAVHPKSTFMKMIDPFPLQSRLTARVVGNKYKNNNSDIDPAVCHSPVVIPKNT